MNLTSLCTWLGIYYQPSYNSNNSSESRFWCVALDCAVSHNFMPERCLYVHEDWGHAKKERDQVNSWLVLTLLTTDCRLNRVWRRKNKSIFQWDSPNTILGQWVLPERLRHVLICASHSPCLSGMEKVQAGSAPYDGKGSVFTCSTRLHFHKTKPILWEGNLSPFSVWPIRLQVVREFSTPVLVDVQYVFQFLSQFNFRYHWSISHELILVLFCEVDFTFQIQRSCGDGLNSGGRMNHWKSPLLFMCWPVAISSSSLVSVFNGDWKTDESTNNLHLIYFPHAFVYVPFLDWRQQYQIALIIWHCFSQKISSERVGLSYFWEPSFDQLHYLI